MNKKLSIIIPTLNEEIRIVRLLNLLKSQTFQDFEVIVADANSTDKTREIAKSYGATIAPGGRTAVGRNNGAKEASTDLLLFLDADVDFDKKFLETGYKEFEKKSLDMACSYFDIRPLGFKMKMIYLLWNSSKFMRRGTPKPDGEGQCIWMKKDVFDKVGRFDKDLAIAEDTDLIHRTVKAGFKYDVLETYFVPSTRRYDKIGTFRVFLGSFVGGIAQLFGYKNASDISEKIYGGWGRFK